MFVKVLTLFVIMINWLDYVYFSLSKKPPKICQQNYSNHRICPTRPPREQFSILCLFFKFLFFLFGIWVHDSMSHAQITRNCSAYSLVICTGSWKTQTLIEMILPRLGFKTCCLKGWKLLWIIILRYVINSGKKKKKLSLV